MKDAIARQASETIRLKYLMYRCCCSIPVVGYAFCQDLVYYWVNCILWLRDTVELADVMHA